MLCDSSRGALGTGEQGKWESCLLGAYRATRAVAWESLAFDDLQRSSLPEWTMLLIILVALRDEGWSIVGSECEQRAGPPSGGARGFGSGLSVRLKPQSSPANPKAKISGVLSCSTECLAAVEV